MVGAGSDGLVAPENSALPVLPGTPIVPPAITALDGPGSEGLNLNQQYTETMVKYRKGRAKHHEKLSEDLKLFALPSNAGPRTMPDYAGLTDQAIPSVSGLFYC